MTKRLHFDEAHPILQTSLAPFGISVIKRDKLTNSFKVSPLKYLTIILAALHYLAVIMALLYILPKLNYNAFMFVMPTVIMSVYFLHTIYQTAVLAETERQFSELSSQTFKKQTNVITNCVEYLKWITYIAVIYLFYFAIAPSMMRPNLLFTSTLSIFCFHVSPATQDHYYGLIAMNLIYCYRRMLSRMMKFYELQNHKDHLKRSSSRLIEYLSRNQRKSDLFGEVSS